MANYPNNVLQFRKRAEPLVKLGLPKPMVILTDGTRSEGNALLKYIISTYLVEPDSSLIYVSNVRKGIYLYCSLINQFNISLNDAEIIIRICMNAIRTNIFMKKANPFIITKEDLYRESKAWNLKYNL